MLSNNSNSHNAIAAVLLHAFLMMYGDDFLQIDREQEGISVTWIRIADGGLVVEDGEKHYPGISIARIIDIVSNANYPTQKDESQCFLWEIQCKDINDQLIAGVEFGEWDRAVLKRIVDDLMLLINDVSVTGGLTRILDYAN